MNQIPLNILIKNIRRRSVSEDGVVSELLGETQILP